MSKFYIIILLITTALLSAQLSTGKGSFNYTTPNGDITVHYYYPEKVAINSPILFVMHGYLRNGEEYRNEWSDIAKERNVILIVPEFSDQAYKGTRGYNLGNIFSENNLLNNKKKWAYNTIESLFDFIQAETGNLSKGYYIYGHSAGGQFVQRMILFKSKNRIIKAVSANSGWYTFTDTDVPYPYGIKYAPITKNDLSNAFSKKMIVMLGSNDTDEGNFKRKRYDILEEYQGDDRYERGTEFFNNAKKSAKKLEMQFNWDLFIVEGASHSNNKMKNPAAELLFSK